MVKICQQACGVSGVRYLHVHVHVLPKHPFCLYRKQMCPDRVSAVLTEYDSDFSDHTPHTEGGYFLLYITPFCILLTLCIYITLCICIYGKSHKNTMRWHFWHCFWDEISFFMVILTYTFFLICNNLSSWLIQHNWNRLSQTFWNCFHCCLRFRPHENADPNRPRVAALIDTLITFKNNDLGAWIRGGDIIIRNSG